MAVVTGASRGIGAATARALAEAGATIVLVARDKASLESVAVDLATSGGRASIVQADLSEADSVATIVQRIETEHDRVDVLVNNAGILPHASRLEGVRRDDWTYVLDLNVTAPWALSCSLKPLMSAGGLIVNVASTAGYYPSRGLGAYCVSKAALIMLTRVCALEWARDRIRVVGVVPGKVDTDMVRPILDYVESHNLPINPLGRVASPSEVGDLIVYLADQRADYITGALIPIDGGELVTAPATY